MEQVGKDGRLLQPWKENSLRMYVYVYMGMVNEAPSIEFHAPFVPHWSEVPGYMGTPAPPAIHTYIHTYIHTQLRRMVIVIHTILRANHLPCMHCSHWNQTLLINMYVCMHVFMYVCMYVLWMYVHMYVCIYACLYEYEWMTCFRKPTYICACM